MCSPSASLTAWATSWLGGSSAPDDLLDAMQAWAPQHRVAAADAVAAGRTGLPWPETPRPGLTELLKTVREAAGAPGARLRLVLPAPGDVRGLTPNTDFTAAAIAAGEGVLAGVPGEVGTGLVPQRRGSDLLYWKVFSEPVPRSAEQHSLGEAEYAMREAVRDAADALARLQNVAVGSTGDPRAGIEAELARSAHHAYPDSMPIRARRILDTADRVAAILTVAARQPASAPASATGSGAQEGALRPLWAAIRAARLAAVNASA